MQTDRNALTNFSKAYTRNRQINRTGTPLKKRRKIIFTVVGLSLAFLAHLELLDNAGLRHTEEGLNRALVTYGVSRGLNGIISVVQGTEIAIEPVGVGMTFTPGQILDPVNDLIERFSTIVLVSATAFGVQRIFLDLVSDPIFSITLSVLIIIALSLLWFGKGVSKNLRQTIFRSAVIFLIIRFSVPAVAIFSENFYQYFLASQYQSSSAQLLSTTDQLKDIQAKTESSVPPAEEQKSLFESAKELYRSATSTFDMQQHLQDFKQAAENISEHAIKLIVIFLFQTIILPLGSVWLVLKTIKWVAVRKM